MSKAIEDVINERKRQIDVEGYSNYHDDQYKNNELTNASICYIHSAQCEAPGWALNFPERLWPWDNKYWNPKSPRQDLIRAAALIIAEIERIDRL